jgi:hypothetical protein
MTDGEQAAEKRAQRIARMKTELVDEQIDLPEHLLDLMVEELVYARHVDVHEGIRPAYGALVASADGLASISNDIRDTAEGVASIRPFADGSTAVIVRDVDTPDVGKLLSIELPDELSRLDLSQKTHGAIVHRGEGGTITITQASGIIVNEVFSWRLRPAARDRLLQLQELFVLEGEPSLELFARLLDLVFHQLSPQGIGATLVVDVRGPGEPNEGALSHEGYASPFPINLRNRDDARTLATFLRIVDGACLVSGDGTLVRTQAKLASKIETSRLLGADRGTRHSSAKWFSFDHPGVVVFVVSADGPVSLYSDGAKVAVFDEVRELPHALNTAPEQAAGLTVVTEVHNCAVCSRNIAVTAYRYPSSDVPITVPCPICGQELVSVEANAVASRPKKPWE